MNKLHSIKEIIQVYDTGDKPVLVQCNDLNDYVCKHSKGHPSCRSLFAEYLAYHFLEMLGVKLPPFAIIEVKEEHIIPSTVCQPRFFKEIDCFGTRLLNYAVEWSSFSFDDSDVKRIKNPTDLFIVAWCDIWLANEDRNWNNFNLLMNPEEEGWYIVPIDHGACLNSLMFDTGRKLVLLDEHSSIIHTEQYKLIAKKHFKKMRDVDDFVKRLYLCMDNFEQSFDGIIANKPASWPIPSTYIQDLKENLFSKEWLNETKTQFLLFTKQSLKIK